MVQKELTDVVIRRFVPYERGGQEQELWNYDRFKPQRLRGCFGDRLSGYRR